MSWDKTFDAIDKATEKKPIEDLLRQIASVADFTVWDLIAREAARKLKMRTFDNDKFIDALCERYKLPKAMVTHIAEGCWKED